MGLTIGTRLGPYEIVAAIGAGGMGEVYRARDTRLKREVALKILPESFASDPDRLARFQREAEVLAALNHPHIAAIYGLEESNCVRALVMELVEGEDLSQRIARGPIPLDDALPIAKQIAEALETAHEQGIIHRDLKPANIKVTPQGVVKVLDFGLAKLNEQGSGIRDQGSGGVAGALSMSPTITSPAMMTGVGVILGTAAYMSPEQAKGREADKRSDLWAFGAVLYEMLTGGRAFDGEDVTDVLVAVLSKEPTWSALPANVPPSIRTLLRRCLQKDRTLRLQAAGDARVEIHEAQSPSAMEPSATGKGKPAPGRRAAALVGTCCLLVGAVVAGLAVWTLKPPPLQSVIRLAVPMPPSERLAALNTPVLALSPDGSRIAFVSARAGGQQIYVRAFNSTESKAIPGTEGAQSPFFSPDGQWLGFAAGGNLMKVSMAGGVPLTICKAPNTVEGVSWGDDETIVFAPGYGASGLSQVSAAGGAPQTISSRDSASEEEGDRWPQLLPGGKAVLFTAWSRNVDDAQIVVQRLDTRERRVIVRGGTYARYVSTGQVIFARAGTLMAVPFNLSRLEAAGTPIPVTQGVLLTTEGAAQFDVSRTGSFVYVPGDVQESGRTLVWVDRAGKEQLLEAPPRNYLNPRISPDGQQIAVVVQGANDDIWMYDIPSRTLSRLTFEARSLSPIWTPDGKRVIYRSARDGHLNLFAKAADGSGKEERLTVSQDNQIPQSVSPDGQVVVFTNAARNAIRDLWVLPLAGDKKPRPFIESRFDDGPAALSPDGRWLAYHSDESGRSEVYVQPFPAGGRKVQISRDGGQETRWTSSGELFYRNGAKIVAVHVTTQPALAVGPPQLVLDGSQYAALSGTFDVTADGQRVLMIKEGERAASATQINVVLNWTEELKRVVSTK